MEVLQIYFNVMKKILIISLTLAASLVKVNAAAITFSAVPTARILQDPSGNAIPNALVLVGTFDNVGAISLLNPTRSMQQNFDLMSQSGGWRQFSLGALTSTSTGRIGGAQSVSDSSTVADTFNEKPLFLWVFNKGTVAGSDQVGIFRSTGTGAWTFPTNGTVGDSVTYSTAPAAAPTIQSFGGAGTPSSSALRLTPVPEPATAALLIVGLVGYASRRRRA